MNARLRALAVLLTVLATVPAQAPARTTSSPTLGPGRSGAVVRELRFQHTRLLVSFVPGDFRLPESELLDWVLRSARAAATFFGRFPVAQVRISLEPDTGAYVGDGIASASPEARIRLAIGRDIKARTLKDDSTLVHEMTHLGFPDLDDIHLWLHEGIATYVETIARAEAGETTPRTPGAISPRSCRKACRARRQGAQRYAEHRQEILGRSDILPGGRRGDQAPHRQPLRLKHALAQLNAEGRWPRPGRSSASSRSPIGRSACRC